MDANFLPCNVTSGIPKHKCEKEHQRWPNQGFSPIAEVLPSHPTPVTPFTFITNPQLVLTGTDGDISRVISRAIAVLV